MIMLKINSKIFITILCFMSCALSFAQDSPDYVNRARSELGKNNFDKVYEITDECIASLKDVATCYFIKGEALMRQGRAPEAIKVFELIVRDYPHAQAWDPRGWFWSLGEKAEITLKKLKTGKVAEPQEQGQTVITGINLQDKGEEFPVDYEKYGRFKNVGAKDYNYIVKDQEGLSAACGEGVYPNTTSFRYNPGFIEVRREIPKVDHWKILNSRDLNLAFYKWNTAGEPWGIKQFYIADLLERAGLIQQAIKAYYAVVVHFPRTYGWTYWQTPWYVASAALDRIDYLLKKHPQPGYQLKGASVEVINGFDNDVSNDIFLVNPGSFVKKNILNLFDASPQRGLGKITKEIGTKVKLVQYQSGDWQLFVDDKPFLVKGITYAPTRVGESPDEGTLANWMKQDTDKDSLIDGPFEAWVDENSNNIKDDNEKVRGDFQLMKEMGVNCIRFYNQPHRPSKELLRKLYKDYGIMTIMGDFMGKYALGSGASWLEGTDYADPVHQENMLKSIEGMVKEYKDEEFILMWILGNENVYGLACNADKDPVSFFKFADKAAKAVKAIDPSRPVAIASGDVLYLDIFAKYADSLDIFGTNVYRGKYGFGSLWRDVKKQTGKPVIITEYGAPNLGLGYSREEAEEFQAQYHKGCWQDIMANSIGQGQGNALGGIVFEWLDEWWKAYEPGYHDRKGLFSGPFLDGYMHEEWLGVAGQGDGSDSPYLRRLKKSYFVYKALWN